MRVSSSAKLSADQVPVPPPTAPRCSAAILKWQAAANQNLSQPDSTRATALSPRRSREAPRRCDAARHPQRMSAKYLTPLSQALSQFFIYMFVNELFLDLPPILLRMSFIYWVLGIPATSVAYWESRRTKLTI